MVLKEIVNSILAFDETATAQCVQRELDRGTDVMAILNDGLIAAMDEVGRRYAQAIFFVPEMLMSAQAMKKGMSVLRPHFEDTRSAPELSIVIGTVKGDQHDIGKNLVAIMLECAGFKVINLGKDVEADQFIEAAQQNGADLIALSALLTATLDSMRATVSKIKTEKNAPKILVGGAPVTQAFADGIGADGFGLDAAGAVAVARRLIGFRENPKERKPPLSE
jgi:5-methyltetrahydrofolate--homocysteine methyltransferase